MDISKTCCFLGHRKIEYSPELEKRIINIRENPIVNEKIDRFLFGSKSEFNSLCYEVVTKLKEKHPYIKRVYIRGEYKFINERYKKYLLEYYDETYFPKKAIFAGKATYVERNYEMIDKSGFTVFYYDKDYNPKNRKSGTKIAYKYAQKKGKIINAFED